MYNGYGEGSFFKTYNICITVILDLQLQAKQQFHFASETLAMRNAEVE